MVIQALGFARACLYNWLARYHAGGWRALRSGKPSGRPKTLSAKHIRWICKSASGSDPRQLNVPFALWTQAIVARVLYQKFGIRLSESSIGCLLRQFGASCQRPLPARAGRMRRGKSVGRKKDSRALMRPPRPAACEFLSRLMDKAQRPVFLIWDGHPVHRSKTLQKHIASFKGKLRVFSRPSHSPELNPAEPAWTNVKPMASGVAPLRGRITRNRRHRAACGVFRRCPNRFAAFFITRTIHGVSVDV